MKNSMKRVFLYVGMGSCLSTKTAEKPHSVTSPMEKSATVISPVIQPSIWEVTGSKDEHFFDSKGWLESDDEDFVSVNGDNSPQKQFNNNNNNRDHQGRKLSELFKDSSFSRDSQTSLKAALATTTDEKEDSRSPAATKMERQKSGRSVKRCIPSLVRTLSCGDRKKSTSSSSHMAVVGG